MWALWAASIWVVVAVGMEMVAWEDDEMVVCRGCGRGENDVGGGPWLWMVGWTGSGELATQLT